MAEHRDVVPIDLPVSSLKFLLQMPAELRAVPGAPSRNAVELPPVPAAGARTGLHDPVLNLHQPLLRLALTPDRVVARQREVRIQDLRIIDDLIPVQNNAVTQVLSRHIKRTDVVARIVIGIVNDLHSRLLLRPLVELLLQMPRDHINFRDPVAPQAVYHRVDHPHAANPDQRLGRLQRQRIHPVAGPRRHDDGALYNMTLLTHLLCLLAAFPVNASSCI